MGRDPNVGRQGFMNWSERLCLKLDLAKTMFSSSVLCLLF